MSQLVVISLPANLDFSVSPRVLSLAPCHSIYIISDIIYLSDTSYHLYTNDTGRHISLTFGDGCLKLDLNWITARPDPYAYTPKIFWPHQLPQSSLVISISPPCLPVTCVWSLPRPCPSDLISLPHISGPHFSLLTTACQVVILTLTSVSLIELSSAPSTHGKLLWSTV